MSLANSIVMPFIELGEDMRLLANTALAGKYPGQGRVKRSWLETIRSRASIYTKKLNMAVEQYLGDKKEEGIPFFTSQEMSILAGISRGLTRKKIADDRFLSTSTVKNIIKTIYAKLGAINRADAIRIASSLDLFRNKN